jgi:uncharacterized protein (DUF1800 family)
MGMTFDEARHLLARTGFGGTPADIRVGMSEDRHVAVSRMLETAASRPGTPPPPWTNRLPPLLHVRRHMSEPDRKAFREMRRQEGLELKQWWYQELLTTNSPLNERMTVFWHNHFTSSLRKVHWAPFLYQQNMLLRIHALGSFRDLLIAIAKNPAMMLYLDTQANQRGEPNENFARELFELFTLGEGHYTERDIKEAARAFTGWRLDPRLGAFRKDWRRHDDEMKTLFGRSGRFDGEDVLSITLDQPQVAPYLVRKLWREFISEDPDEQEVERLAVLFRRSNYQIRPLLNELFLSPHFWAPANRGVLIKSPVDLLVGTIRLFQVPIEEPMHLVRFGRRLGQDLFDPPNVKGWPGGTRWITTSTLLERWQAVQRIVRGHEGGHQAGMERSTQTQGAAWLEQEPLDVVQATLLPIEPVRRMVDDEDRWQVVRRLVLDPVYQLK